jgi:hypothetical protein
MVASAAAPPTEPDDRAAAPLRSRIVAGAAAPPPKPDDRAGIALRSGGTGQESQTFKS